MILREIIKNTRAELKARKKSLPLPVLRAMANEQSQTVDLAEALAGERMKLIAEVKRASPSRGVIRDEFNPLEIAKIYSANGASAISILTDAKYFQGNLDYLAQISAGLRPDRPPLLRKDFIFDPYQIYESRAYGADALLLIAALLTDEALKELLELSQSLNMQCLVEVHNEQEVEQAIASGAHIIGINNRDLNTFKVDLNNTVRLRPLIPEDRLVISESGIKTRRDIEKLQTLGVNALLVGEALMASEDIASAIRKFL